MCKIAIITLLIGLLCTHCKGQSKNQLKDQNIQMKNYAFCECLSLIYKGDSLFQIDGSQAGYFETGTFDLAVLAKIDSLSLVFSKKEYKSKEGHKLGIMKCLDYYNSKELDSLVIRYTTPF